jgi:uncharacterized protein (DUF3084 family)
MSVQMHLNCADPSLNWSACSTQFVDFMNQYIQIYSAKKSELETNLDNLRLGLKKIQMLKQIVANTKNELASLKPLLQKVTEDTKRIEDAIVKNGKSVKDLAKMVRQEQIHVNAKNNEYVQLKEDEAKGLEEYDKVVPVINAAIAGVRSITKSDIEELKGIVAHKPPGTVILVSSVNDDCCM